MILSWISRTRPLTEHWDEPGTQDVDYNTLDGQHLGSIYEGLLELQPHIAIEAMVQTLVDGKPVFKPAREVPSPRPIRGQPPRPVNTSEVYLVTDRGERKATGSYYMPTYIVDYIVEHTVGPIPEEAAKQVAALLAAVANCWLALFFSVPVTPEQYERTIKALRSTDTERQILAQEPWFEKAQVISQQKRFFHWELEFPKSSLTHTDSNR